jgi:RNA polymerase sigma-70 factor (ECF subfamily)
MRTRIEAGIQPLSDAEIARRLQGGDASLLGELHRRYRKRLEGVAFRLLRDRHEAEDVVQRVFLALPRCRYHGAASLTTYLYRAATNAAVNALRSRRRRELAASELQAHALGDRGGGPPSPESRVLESEILSAVASALLAVKPQHRRVLVLRIVWGLGNSEIAEREEVPLATVGTWLRRGREELRRQLGPLIHELGPLIQDPGPRALGPRAEDPRARLPLGRDPR